MDIRIEDDKPEPAKNVLGEPMDNPLKPTTSSPVSNPH